MNVFPKKLAAKMEARRTSNTLRKLPKYAAWIDFSSNDYLGFAKSEVIFRKTHELLEQKNIRTNGATGSRLLSGNHQGYQEMEHLLANFHNAEAALLFNSGYDANIGFFSSVPQRGTIILYDEYIHASIRDGITMSHAKSYKFKHNDLDHLEKQLSKITSSYDGELYIVTESVFSMDGDSPNLMALTQLCQQYQCYLIVDEAHALGVFGAQGRGLLHELGLENQVFARIITFGKALGCHGAAVLGSAKLRDYLVNFARSFIYTTGLPPHALATIHTVYTVLQGTTCSTNKNAAKQLHDAIAHFNKEVISKQLNSFFISSQSAIHCAIIPGNDCVKTISQELQYHGFDVKPIVSPTVPKGQERIRFCLHNYNSSKEISDVLERLATFVL